MTNPSSATEALLRFLSAVREPSADRREPTTDWNEVVAMAVRHGLAPLLFKRLKESDARDGVPTEAWEQLRLAYFASARRNTRLYRGLRTVLQCLRGSGIPVIVLKGAFLAEAVYGDVALRPMYDVDLMVPRAELSRALAVLLDMGGVQREDDDIESHCRSFHHLSTVVIRGLAVELHWTLEYPTGPVRVDAAGLWDRAHTATIAGVDVLALSPEDMLLHLCVHLSYHHRLGGLRYFCDVAETIHRFRGEVDWAQVVHSAHEWGAARYVGLTLHLARSVSDARVPDDVLERLAPGGMDERILETARGCLLAQTGYYKWKLDPLQTGVESFGDKARVVRARVFLSRDEMAAKYPASRDSRHLCFYHALRLRDAIRASGAYSLKRCRLMMRSLRRDPEASLVNWLKSGKPVRQTRGRAKAKESENP